MQSSPFGELAIPPASPNIFKVEKLLRKFINNIFVVIDADKILNINMSLKKKNYDQGINLKTLESLLIEAKNLCLST